MHPCSCYLWTSTHPQWCTCGFLPASVRVPSETGRLGAAEGLLHIPPLLIMSIPTVSWLLTSISGRTFFFLVFCFFFFQYLNSFVGWSLSATESFQANIEYLLKLDDLSCGQTSLIVCHFFPVLKLLKMATGMRALLDTVVQALPQVCLITHTHTTHCIFP